MSFNDFLQEKFLPRANKIAANKYLQSVSDAFMYLTPVFIIGAMFALFNSLAIPSYQAFLKNTGLKSVLSIPSTVTLDLLAIYAVFMIASCLAKRYDKDQGVAGIIALITFLCITPIGNVSTYINNFMTANKIELAKGVSVPGGNVLPFDWVGSRGVFVAIIVGLISTVIYSKLVDKGVAIKLPDSVPAAVGRSFAGLLPGFVIVILFIALDKIVASLGFKGITGLHTLIYQSLQAPMELFLGNSLISIVVAIFVAQLLWFFGIHGPAAVITPLFIPLWTTLSTANIAAMNAGVSMYDLPNIIGRPFFTVYAVGGGSGVTLGLCLYMAFRAKSKQYKTLGKLALPAGICSINEPIIFGMPVVLNPALLIPWILAPLVTIILAYFLTAIDILPRLATIIPFGTPVIMSAFLAGGTEGWRVALFQLIMIGVTALIYIPFFRSIDKKALASESESGSENI